MIKHPLQTKKVQPEEIVNVVTFNLKPKERAGTHCTINKDVNTN